MQVTELGRRCPRKILDSSTLSWSCDSAGLVGITSACAVVEHYGAVIIGGIAGLLMIAGSKLLRRLRIDDPLDSIAVHFFCGIWYASAMHEHTSSCL